MKRAARADARLRHTFGRAYRGMKGRLTRDRLMKLGWYGALVLLLTALGAASYGYRNRPLRREAAPTPPPVSAMALSTPAPVWTPRPEPTPEPMRFVWPVTGEIVGEYAPDVPVWSSTLAQWQTHAGIDIAAGAGEVVAACADGTVTDAWRDPLWGNVITIEHADGYVSTCANLNTLNMVSVGDEVAAGDVISAVGDSASCEADLPWHLHFELTRDGEPVDFEKIMAGQAN